MLYRIFGPVGSGKGAHIRSQIRAALLQGKRVFVLVPEQQAATYEYQIVEDCGTLSQNAEVTNFSRLSNIVFRAVGFPQGRIPTTAEKKLLLANLVHGIKDTLPALKLKEDPESVSGLLSEMESLKLLGLTPKVLSQLSEREFSSPRLSELLSQTALLTSSFAKLSEGVFRDPSDEGEHLYRALSEYAFFEKSAVFIDGFWDFTYIQEKIIEKILSQAEDVTVSFAAKKGDLDLFEKPLKAARRILAMAREKGIEVRDITLEKKEDDSALGHLRTHFMTKAVPYDKKIENLSLTACKNSGEEALFVAEKILDLVRRGARFSDIAVLSRDGAGEEMLSLIFQEKGIPHFCEEKKPLSATQLSRTVLLSVRLALGLGEEGEVRTYIKNGVFSAPEEERFALETYVSTWSLSRRKILQEGDFVFHPEGYFEPSDRSREELKLVNRAKERIFAPLNSLSFALAGGNVLEKIGAVISHLTRLGTEKELLSAVEKAREEKDFEKAGELLRTWNSLLSALSALGRTLGEEECDGPRFLELLTLSLSDPLPGKLPPGQDRVQIGRVDFSRPENTKYVFVTGLSAGVFPAPAPKGGLFQKGEREELRSLGYPLPGSSEDLLEEYFYFHLAASFAEKELYLSFSTGEGEMESGALSVIGKHVLTLFPQLSVTAFDLAGHVPQTPEEAFSRYLSLLGTESEEEEALSEYFLALPQWKERVLSASCGMATREGRDLLQKEKPYEGKDMGMVYSRLEKYTLCPFSYFARYLLKAETREKATVGAGIAGSFVHRVLELVLQNVSGEKKDFIALSREELVLENEKATFQALVEIGITEISGSLIYLVERLKESCLLILENLKEEFSQSGFRPLFFEKSLSDLDGVYHIPLQDGTSLCLYGYIDRVDQYTAEDGKQYVRVVDYKTGGHDFNLTDVGNGLSLQMLLYLFALWNQGYEQGGEKVKPLPAGVIYLNGLATPGVCENEEDLKLLAASPYESLSREGLLVDDPELLAAQDKEGLGKFIPVAWGKDRPTGTSSLVSLENLGRLKKKVEKDLKILAENLKEGKVGASPLTSKGRKIDPCKFCEYLPICRRSEGDRRPYQSRLSKEEIFGEVEE